LEGDASADAFAGGGVDELVGGLGQAQLGDGPGEADKKVPDPVWEMTASQ